MAETHNIIIDNVTHDLTDGVVTHHITTEVVTHEIGAEQGPPWPPGESAYQIALDNGFIGTEADWLASLEFEWQFDSYPQDLALEYWIAKNI